MLKLHVINDKMTEKHISQSELARMTNLGQSYISMMLAGDRGISLDTLFMILSALDLTLDDVIADEYKNLIK